MTDAAVFYSTLLATLISVDWPHTLITILIVGAVVGVLVSAAVGAAQFGMRKEGDE